MRAGRDSWLRGAEFVSHGEQLPTIDTVAHLGEQVGFLFFDVVSDELDHHGGFGVEALRARIETLEFLESDLHEVVFLQRFQHGRLGTREQLA